MNHLARLTPWRSSLALLALAATALLGGTLGCGSQAPETAPAPAPAPALPPAPAGTPTTAAPLAPTPAATATATPQAATTATTTTAAGVNLPADAEPVVNVYMWSEYIDPALPEQFEKETGIKVRLSYYEATEEMMAKLQQAGGTAQYDVLVAADHSIPVMAKLGLLQPIRRDEIPNASNVDPMFQNAAYDPSGAWSLPYQWGTMGLMYRKDMVPNMQPTWAMALDPARQPGPVVLIDSMRDMLGAALKWQGHSLNTTDTAELEAATAAIVAAKKSSKTIGFEGGVGGKNKVAAGEAAIAIVYNGDAFRAVAEDPNCAYVVPDEGSLIWVDAMLVPSQAPHPNNARRFINFILDPQVGATLSNFNQYATPNQAALPLIKPEDRQNPGIYPPAEQIAKMEYLSDLGASSRMYDDARTSAKSK